MEPLPKSKTPENYDNVSELAFTKLNAVILATG